MPTHLEQIVFVLNHVLKILKVVLRRDSAKLIPLLY